MFQNIITDISFFFLKQKPQPAVAGSRVRNGCSRGGIWIASHQSTPHSHSSPLPLPLIPQGEVKSSNHLKPPPPERTPLLLLAHTWHRSYDGSPLLGCTTLLCSPLLHKASEHCSSSPTAHTCPLHPLAGTPSVLIIDSLSGPAEQEEGQLLPGEKTFPR